MAAYLALVLQEVIGKVLAHLLAVGQLTGQRELHLELS
jgi:hypothetical protein